LRAKQIGLPVANAELSTSIYVHAGHGPADDLRVPTINDHCRAENSHQPTRQRERAMKKFTSARHAQRFLSAFSGISPHFRPGRHRLSAREYRREMDTRFTTWNQITGTATTAEGDRSVS